MTDDRDRKRRLEWLRRVVEEHGWRLHAFVLMSNHEHLLVETPEANLSRGMKLLNGAYTQYFNKRHRRSGHLFQGRYKVHVVEEQGYWSVLSRYIHLNPVRAKLVEDPADYRWSSFPGYARRSRALEWVEYRRVLADHGPGDRATRRRRYARYVGVAVGERLEPPWAEALEGLVIGSSDFLERLRSSSGVERPDPERKGSRAMAARPSAEAMAEEAAEALGVDSSAWAEGTRHDDASRALAAYVLRRELGYPRGEVADALGYGSGSAVTMGERRVRGTKRLLKEARALSRAISPAFSDANQR